MTLQNAHVVDFLKSAQGWNDATMEADEWCAHDEISPIDAAMLLLQHNPNECDFERTSSDGAGATTYEESDHRGQRVAFPPGHLRMLARRLADIKATDGKKRTLRDWHQVARDKGLTYHSWIDGYMEATAQPAPRVAVTARDAIKPTVAPMPRQIAQEERILELIKAGGHDALKLPSPEPGKKGIKSSIKKQALSEPSMFSANSFDKAWQRVRDDGKLNEA